MSANDVRLTSQSERTVFSAAVHSGTVVWLNEAADEDGEGLVSFPEKCFQTAAHTTLL